MDPLALIVFGGALAVGSLLFGGGGSSGERKMQTVSTSSVSIDSDWCDSVGTTYVNAANATLNKYTEAAKKLNGCFNKISGLYAHEFQSQKSDINSVCNKYDSIMRSLGC